MRFVSISLLSSRSIRANPQHSVLTNSTRLVYSHPSSSYPSHIPQAQFSSSPMPLGEHLSQAPTTSTLTGLELIAIFLPRLHSLPAAYDEKPIIYKPRSGASTGTVIMLHGLGDTSGGWSDVAEMLQADPKLRSVRLFPPLSVIYLPLKRQQHTISTQLYCLPSFFIKKTKVEFFGSSVKVVGFLCCQCRSHSFPSTRRIACLRSNGSFPPRPAAPSRSTAA